jgi:hypothetical protein
MAALFYPSHRIRESFRAISYWDDLSKSTIDTYFSWGIKALTKETDKNNWRKPKKSSNDDILPLVAYLDALDMAFTEKLAKKAHKINPDGCEDAEFEEVNN